MRELVQACVFYMFCSAGMSVFNKLAVRAMPLPITLVIVQMSFTLASITMQRKSVHIGSMRDALRWGLTVPMLFAAMLVSSMVAMEHNTLGTIVVFRNVAPLFTLLIERMFRIPMVVNLETIAALLSIVVGVVLYHFQSIGFTTIVQPHRPSHRRPRPTARPLRHAAAIAHARGPLVRARRGCSPSASTWPSPCSSASCSATSWPSRPSTSPSRA